MINRQNKDFENIFSGKSDIVEYLEIEDVSIAIKEAFGDKRPGRRVGVVVS